MSPPNSNINTDTKNHMLKSIFVLTNVLLHIKQTGLHQQKKIPCHVNKVATFIYYHHQPPPHQIDIFNPIKYIYKNNRLNLIFALTYMLQHIRQID